MRLSLRLTPTTSQEQGCGLPKFGGNGIPETAMNKDNGNLLKRLLKFLSPFSPANVTILVECRWITRKRLLESLPKEQLNKFSYTPI